MKKLDFSINQGIKEYCFADDENAIIRINTRDINLYTRIVDGQKQLNQLAEKYKNFTSDNPDDISAMLKEWDEKVRKIIDSMFDSPVSDVAFRNGSCVAIYDGTPVFQLFLEALLKEVGKDMGKEFDTIEKNINKTVSIAEKFD